ncbi:sigma-70 family RNA polymerase sigma factor [Oscillatoria sp. FACHB-1406]|uniref:sigma-70 family RNA polymerase sigma factor n=1 Tax=Oscillatoria sp. FACHB-1406 TaxID=2692846 RepID=UPI0016879A71|nr:sigma-70 family RNA polymerase sigma factor [Oscillatoria sp. FACHB-1406]MBD2579885.1 sigma-70 family RNA polymerase sigma factor [Oscillatoria sp. FACHB-1406]
MDADSIDTRLKQYALEARRYPPKSKGRQKALTALIAELQNSDLLCRPFPWMFQESYKEIYAEAQQMLFGHICEKIDCYDPDKRVLQWANFLLKKRFFVQACRAIYPNSKQKKGRLFFHSLDDFESLETLERLRTRNAPLLSEQILDCLAEDPQGLFESTYTKKPEANFQYIAQQLVAGYTWRELSLELGLEISTLSSFYTRYLKKFSPLLKSYLKT